MAIYRPTSSAGSFTNPTYAYDTVAGGAGYKGNLSTCATASATGTGSTLAQTYMFGSYAVSGDFLYVYLSCTLNAYFWAGTAGAVSGTNGSVAIDYSWDGTTWTNLLTARGGIVGSGATGGYLSCPAIADTIGHNLNTLRVRVSCTGGQSYNGSSYTNQTSSASLYDIVLSRPFGMGFYIPAFDHAVPDTISGKTVYSSYAFSSLTGVVSTPSLDRSVWIASADSQYGTQAPSYAISEQVDPLHFWCSAATYPHYFIVNLGRPCGFSSIVVDPSSDAAPGRYIQKWEVYVSTDGVSWGSAIATGAWGSSDIQTITVPPQTDKQYIKLVGLTGSDAYMTVRAIWVGEPTVMQKSGSHIFLGDASGLVYLESVTYDPQ